MASSSEKPYTVSKEVFLEKRLVILERRVTLVERFMEMRFCTGGSLRDFSVRKEQPHPVSDPDVESEKVSSKSSSQSTKTPKTASVPQPAKKAQSSSSNEEPSRKELRLCLSRVENKLPEASPNTNAKDNTFRETQTRRSNRIRTRNKIRIAVITDDEHLDGDGEEMRNRLTEESEDVGQGVRDNDAGSDVSFGFEPEACSDNEEESYSEYILFPSDTKPIVVAEEVLDPLDDNSLNEDHDDLPYLSPPSPSARDDCSSNNDQDSPSPKPKSKKSRSKRKRPTSSTGKDNIKSPKTPPKKKVASEFKWKNSLTPIAALPSAAKVISTDPTKKECPFCHIHIKLERFESHVVIHTKERTVKCDLCDKAFFNRVGLKKHLITHNLKDHATNCRVCGKTWYKKDKLLKHERFCIRVALTKGKPVDPDIMEDVRRRSVNDVNWPEPPATEENDKTVEENAEKASVKCPRCEKKIRKNKLEGHLKAHQIRELPHDWKCNLCEKSYTSKRSLVRHMCIVHAEKSADKSKSAAVGNDEVEVEEDGEEEAVTQVVDDD